MDVRFCYEIAAEAGFAHDTVTGENAPAYMQVKFGGAKNPPTPEEYLVKHEGSIRDSVAAQLRISPDLLKPISTEEYDATMGEDEDYIED